MKRPLPQVLVSRCVTVDATGRTRFHPQGSADPPAEYRQAAVDAAIEAIAELGHKGDCRIAYVADDSPGIGYAGFFSDDYPDVIWIVVDRTPLARLRETVRHELHHLVSHARGRSAEEEALEEEEADVFGAGARPYWDRSESQASARVTDAGEIDDEPLAVGGGKITVTNAGGTVVIDGTSNMFKIRSTGTLSPIGNAVAGTISAAVDLVLNLPYIPAFLGYRLAPGSVTEAALLPEPVYNPLTGAIRRVTRLNATMLSASTTRMTAYVDHDGGMEPDTTVRYYVLQEAAF